LKLPQNNKPLGLFVDEKGYVGPMSNSKRTKAIKKKVINNFKNIQQLRIWKKDKK